MADNYSNSIIALLNTRYEYLVKLADKKFTEDFPEVRLLSAVLINAVKFCDREYINGDGCAYICKFLRLDVKIVRLILIHAVDVIEGKEKWDHKREATQLDGGEYPWDY